jgi:hypothetical protein
LIEFQYFFQCLLPESMYCFKNIQILLNLLKWIFFISNRQFIKNLRTIIKNLWCKYQKFGRKNQIRNQYFLLLIEWINNPLKNPTFYLNIILIQIRNDLSYNSFFHKSQTRIKFTQCLLINFVHLRICIHLNEDLLKSKLHFMC